MNFRLPGAGQFAADTGQVGLSVQLWSKHLVVDLRTSVDRAPDGSLFVGTSSCPPPIPPADLSKFDAVAGMTRVYDSGNIIVYALSEAAYVP